MKIALTFSGGGYRAAAYDLGALTYLEQVQIEGQPLLNEVIALSTVSGGTITGARYALGIKQGESLNSIYHVLYDFFTHTDLITESIKRLNSTERWDGRIKSLINSFADTYDTTLFDRKKFGTLLREDPPIHLHHISFNATEFTTALQFRFQISDEVSNAVAGKGIIGNYYHQVPEYVAKEIRMADILAASSCFPGGFEPINFPNDFVMPATDEIIHFKDNKGFPVGLMDGGIVDNQGIEPILLAEQRMKQDNPNKNETNLDLIIVSDVASPYMEGFKSSIQKPEKGWRKLSIKKLHTYLISIAVLSILGIGCSVHHNLLLPLILLTVIGTCAGALSGLLFLLVRQIKQNPTVEASKLKGLANIKLGILESLIKNRVMSVLKLTGNVFLKHIRRLNYAKLYDDPEWKNRLIMNAIYELRERGINHDLYPSPEIKKVAGIAAGMGTSLWFSKEELQNKMPDSLIACGQFTLCWNLLEYIEKLKKDNSNTNASHAMLIACEEQIRSHWTAFQKDPYWLVRRHESLK